MLGAIFYVLDFWGSMRLTWSMFTHFIVLKLNCTSIQRLELPAFHWDWISVYIDYADYRLIIYKCWRPCESSEVWSSHRPPGLNLWQTSVNSSRHTVPHGLLCSSLNSFSNVQTFERYRNNPFMTWDWSIWALRFSVFYFYRISISISHMYGGFLCWWCYYWSVWGASYCVWWMCSLADGGVRGQNLSQRSGC